MENIGLYLLYCALKYSIHCISCTVDNKRTSTTLEFLQLTYYNECCTVIHTYRYNLIFERNEEEINACITRCRT